MTWDGRYASYSPVPNAPGWGSPPADPASQSWASPSAPAAYAWAPNPGFASPPADPPPAAPKKRSQAWIWVVASVVALGLFAGGVIAVRQAMTTGTQMFTDEQNRVSVVLPRTFGDLTEPELEPEPGEEDYWLPAIDAETFMGLQTVLVYVDDKDTELTLAEAHDAGVDEQCHISGCGDVGAPQPATIAGRPALQSVVRYPDGAGAAVIATVLSERWTVQVIADRAGALIGPTETEDLQRYVATLTITD